MGYVLLATEETVQVISPSVSQDIVYSTIQTTPNNVVASIAIPLGTDPLGSGAQTGRLHLFANAIEEVLALDYVIGAVGQQSIDVNGLLTDNVAFTVQYVPTSGNTTQITAVGLVPVSVLVENQSGPAYQADISGAEAILQPLVAGLQALAAG